MVQLSIAGRPIGPEHPPYLIAEIGANHNGSVELCRELIHAAVEAGADAVKFQSWTVQSLIGEAEYARNTRYIGDGTPGLREAVEQYQTGEAMLRDIAATCAKAGITWFASAFADDEVALLEELGVPGYKVASMDVTHLPLLASIAATGKPVLLSTGMATLGEVEAAVEALRAGGSGPVALLHCVSVYPCPPELTHLRTLATWREAFGLPVGYSDHTLGVGVPVAAVALGACIVEKHFTTDKALPGWDHGISADPAEFRALAEAAHAAHAALGSGVRRVGEDELAKRRVFRRRMVAARPLKAGSRIAAARERLTQQSDLAAGEREVRLQALAELSKRLSRLSRD